MQSKIDKEIVAQTKSRGFEYLSRDQNQTLGYMQNIASLSTLSNFHTHHNAWCVKCKAMHLKMVRVGAVIFCADCVQEEFFSKDPVRKERETYLKWLHKSHENEG